MHYHTLGRSDLKVSRLGLGTMTFGEQNTEAEAHAQLDLALAAGINFIDTAEMYPVPPRAETQGRTEAFIGSWLKRRGCRDRLILASKVVGPAERVHHIRQGPRLSAAHVRQALEASLQRLNTDYLDLYQVHWPERRTNYFGRLGYPAPDPGEHPIPIEETLGALAALRAEGKIRHYGLSNETPWGAMHYLQLADRHGWPRAVSIQNPYNLLNRTFEIGLAEIAHRERLPLVAYSPLAFGVLSGKYLGALPPGSRLQRFPEYSRYTNAEADRAADRYCRLAREHGVSPAQMALAYIQSRPFLGSALIGATQLAQLEEDLASAALALSDELISGIEAIHRQQPNPCP